MCWLGCIYNVINGGDLLITTDIDEVDTYIQFETKAEDRGFIAARIKQKRAGLTEVGRADRFIYFDTERY